MSRSTFVYRPGHPRANERGFVNANELGEETSSVALNAPILSGRFYENVSATDGTDIGSRKKHREYMKAHGLTIASDYTNTWKQAEKQREAVKQGRLPSKTRREAIARALYRIDKP